MVTCLNFYLYHWSFIYLYSLKFFFSFFAPLLAILMAHRICCARDGIQATAVTYTIALAMPEPQPAEPQQELLLLPPTFFSFFFFFFFKS